MNGANTAVFDLVDTTATVDVTENITLNRLEILASENFAQVVLSSTDPQSLIFTGPDPTILYEAGRNWLQNRVRDNVTISATDLTVVGNTAAISDNWYLDLQADHIVNAGGMEEGFYSLMEFWEEGALNAGFDTALYEPYLNLFIDDLLFVDSYLDFSQGGIVGLQVERIPEPGSLTLAALAALGVLTARRRRS